jgi:hypothetical protein
MADLRGFDANNVEPAGDFEPIPAGKYLAVITDSEMKPTKSGAGSYLQLTFQVIDGEYRNRLLWARLNLDHPNRETVTIARAQLSAVCRAVGVMQPKDSVELHNLPLVISVKCEKRDDTGEIVNKIKAYERRDAASPAASLMPASPSKAPWQR